MFTDEGEEKSRKTSHRVPRYVRDALLPKPSLSIQDLLLFRFLDTCPDYTTSQKIKESQRYFSHLPATTENANDIQAIPIPPHSIRTQLQNQWRREAEQGALSVDCTWMHRNNTSKDTARVPLWSIRLWEELVMCQETYKKPWTRVVKYLALRQSSAMSTTSQALVARVYETLSSVSWSGYLNGFDEKDSIYHLAKFGTDAWLTDVQEDQMLQLLRRDLQEMGLTDQVQFLPTSFFHALRESYDGSGIEGYDQDFHFQLQRVTGTALEAARCDFASIVNINGNHWLSVIIRREDNMILIGNSLHSAKDDNLLLAINWWVRRHLGFPFTVGELHAVQQIDTSSCGLLAFNALAHHYLPLIWPEMDPSLMDDERLRMMLKVVAHHQENVSFINSAGNHNLPGLTDR